MTPSLTHLHVAHATQAEQVRAATSAVRSTRRSHGGRSRALRNLLLPPRVQVRAA